MNKKLLIVEDHEDVRMIYKAIFRKDTDIEIDEVESAEQALERLKTTTPDLVVVDISLPGMNGIELTRILSRQYPSVKIIVITGHVAEQYHETAIQAGADDLVSKNSIQEIAAAVKRLLTQ